MRDLFMGLSSRHSAPAIVMCTLKARQSHDNSMVERAFDAYAMFPSKCIDATDALGILSD